MKAAVSPSRSDVLYNGLCWEGQLLSDKGDKTEAWLSLKAHTEDCAPCKKVLRSYKKFLAGK